MVRRAVVTWAKATLNREVSHAESITLRKSITLFRPVGPRELELIKQLDFRAFPPRLPEQPIFYPVLNEEYAVQIARLER